MTRPTVVHRLRHTQPPSNCNHHFLYEAAQAVTTSRTLRGRKNGAYTTRVCFLSASSDVRGNWLVWNNNLKIQLWFCGFQRSQICHTPERLCVKHTETFQICPVDNGEKAPLRRSIVTLVRQERCMGRCRVPRHPSHVFKTGRAGSDSVRP